MLLQEIFGKQCCVIIELRLQSCQPLWFSVLHYARTLKTMINLPFPVIVPCGAVVSLSWPHTVSQGLLARLYFGEYPQAVTCSAQPVWCSPCSSCSRPHGLKAFAAPANQNGAFISGGPRNLLGWCALPMQEILSFVQYFLIQR